MLIDITKGFEPWSQVPNLENLIVTAAKAATAGHPENVPKGAELSILLASDETVRELNVQYRNIDKPTNVLSFPGEQEEAQTGSGYLLGDIVLGYETVKAEADQQKKSFENHISHLVVHGVLHLLGHDHEDDDTADSMELLEIDILKGISVENPYA